MGRHQQVIAADHASLHLRCLRCGHRSNGWQLGERESAREAPQPWRRPTVAAMPRQHA
jgi:hypothetical protein